MLVRLQLSEDVLAQIILRDLVFLDYEGNRLDEAVLILDHDHHGFGDGRVLEQAGLDLDRAQPFSFDLEGVVGSASVRDDAPFVDRDQVSADHPVVTENAGGQFRLFPVTECGRFALYPQETRLASGHPVALHIPSSNREPLDRFADSPGRCLTQPVGYEDVPHLGRAETVEQLDPEPSHPPLVKRLRERLPAEVAKRRLARSALETESRATIALIADGVVTRIVGR